MTWQQHAIVTRAGSFYSMVTQFRKDQWDLNKKLGYITLMIEANDLKRTSQENNHNLTDTWLLILCKRICKLGHLTFKGYFARKNLN